MARTQDEVERREYLRQHNLDDERSSGRPQSDGEELREQAHHSDDYDAENPEEIEASIRRTRAEMDETIDELQDRLSPRHLLDDVSRFFRRRKARKQAEAAASDHDQPGKGKQIAQKVGSGVWHFVRDHPVPAVLITTAVTTLIYEVVNHKTKDKRGRYDGNYGRASYEEDQPPMHSGSHVHATSGQPYSQGHFPFRGERPTQQHSQEPGMMQRTGEGAREMASKAREKMSEAGESVRSGMHRMREGMSSAGEHVSDTMHHGYERAKHGMQHTRDFIEERPITVGLGALALGLVVGLLIPRSQREDDLMGEQSDNLIERGKEKGHDLYERGKEVASETMEAATDTAREESQKQGLAPDQ